MAHSQQEQSPDNIQYVLKVWANMKNNSPIYQFLLSDIEIRSATKAGSFSAQLEVKPVHLNSKGTLHGTVSACLIDWAGGLAIASTGLEKTGASTDMHTSFVSTAREGDTLKISARAAKVGGTLAFTNVEISKIGEDGHRSVVSTGSHTKYVKQ